MKSAWVTIRNERGLHATPACMFAQTAMKFKSRIKVSTADKAVNAKALVLVVALGAKAGDELLIMAEGADEQEAVAALVDLVERRNFNGE